jgi:hypothetical protein
MIREGLLVDNGYKISLPDGGRLPMLPANGESMETFLRRLFGPVQEPASQGRTASVVTVERPYSSHTYGRETAQGNWQVMEADRSERPNLRFNPIARPDNHVTRSPSQGRPYVEIPPRPRQQGPPRVLIPPPPKAVKPKASEIEPPKMRMDPAKPPIILKRAVEFKVPPVPKEKLNNIPNEDIEMADAHNDKPKVERVYTPRVPPKMQFTTDLRQKVDIQKVMTQIYDQEVKLPLGTILGIAGEVSKELNNATRTHKDYVGKTSEHPREAQAVTFFDSEDSEYFSDDEDSEEYEYDSAQDLVDYRTVAHSAGISELKHMLDRNLYAMGTGKLEVKVGPFEGVAAMIDTGSELNLISQHLWEQLRLPLDPGGSSWGIRGVNGGSENLLGFCRRVPIIIGGLRFYIHFFIKKGPISAQYQLLMGQPWLDAVAAQITYSSSPKRSMRLRIYENGDTTGNSLIINLGIDTAREATKLIQCVQHIEPDKVRAIEEIDGPENESDVDLAQFFDLPCEQQSEHEVPEATWERFESLSLGDTSGNEQLTNERSSSESRSYLDDDDAYRGQILQSLRRHRERQHLERVRRRALLVSNPVMFERYRSSHTPRRPGRIKVHGDAQYYRPNLVSDLPQAEENTRNPEPLTTFPYDNSFDDSHTTRDRHTTDQFSDNPHNDFYLPNTDSDTGTPSEYPPSQFDDHYATPDSVDDAEPPSKFTPPSSYNSTSSPMNISPTANDFNDDLPSTPSIATGSDDLLQLYHHAGAEPSENVEQQLEPSIPSLGRKLSEAL